MIKRLKKILFKIILFRLLPLPTKKEINNIKELRTAFNDLPIMELENLKPSEATWSKNMNRLRYLVINKNPRKFLKWNVIGNTMFIADAKYIPRELKYLKLHSDWEGRWKEAIKESHVGHPTRYKFYTKTSGSLIHYAYHISQFEEKCKKQIQDMDFIFEFGGGYGGLCKLIHGLGFRGKYIIFDLPHFSILQNYYLKTLNLHMHSIDTFNESSDGIICVSKIDELNKIISSHNGLAKKMFIATWSISETSIRMREGIFPLLSDYNNFLLAYQNSFEEVDNISFFSNWKESMDKITWNTEKINHLPASNYLFGTIK